MAIQPIGRTKRLLMRDVRTLMREYGAEKGVSIILERLIDEKIGHEQQMAQMADLQSRMIDMLTQLGTATGHLKQAVDLMKRNQEKFDQVQGEGIQH